MKEFRDAHAHVTGNARKKFLIPLLCGDVTEGDLATDLKFYLENHTYIKHKNVVHFLSLLRPTDMLSTTLAFHKIYLSNI